MERKINVMHIIADLDFGGTQNQLRTLALGLDKSKYNVSVCCLRQSGFFAQEIERNGIPVFVLGKKKRIDLELILKVRKLLIENKIDIVHTHNWTGNLWGRCGAIAAGVKNVIAREANIGRERWTLHFFIDKMLSYFTTYIIANSKACRDTFLVPKEGIAFEKVKIIYGAVDGSIADKKYEKALLKSKYNVPNDAFVIGTISRLDRVKGHKYLIQAAKEVARRNKNVVFLIAGEDATLQKELETIAKECGVSKHIKFIGWVEKVGEVYSIIDAFALPSLTESLPVSIIEAMFFGAPVVATTVGGIPELVVDGKTGFLVPPASAEALAEKIIAIMEDKALRERFSVAAKERAKALFATDTMVKEVEKLYQSTTKVLSP